MNRLLTFLLLLGFLTTYSQETETPQVQDSVDIVTSFEVTQITKSIEEEAQLLREIQANLDNQGVKIEVDSLIPLYREQYETLADRIESGLYIRVSPLEQQQLLREVNDFIAISRSFIR